jgi:hypothetical protein
MNKNLFTPALSGNVYRFLNAKVTLLALLLCILASPSFALVTVTAATGGTNICSNKAVTGSAPGCTTLGNITVAETNNSDLTGGGGTSIITDTLILQAPTGWQFCSTTPTFTWTAGRNIQNVSVLGTVGPTSITVLIDVNKTNKSDQFVITGLQVQPLTTSAPSGTIYASTATGIAGINTISMGSPTAFGALSITPLPITGPSNLCPASSIALADATTGGAWVSTPTSVATVTATGVVGGVAAGTANISYTVAGCTTVHTVTVGSPAPISGPTTVCVGSSITLADLSGSTGTGTWMSSTTSVATLVSGAPPSSASVTGSSTGTTTITYTYSPGCYSTYMVSVYPTIPAITIPRNPICVGDTETLSIGVTGGTWSANIPSSLGIDPVTGFATGLASNVVTVIYTLGCSRTATLTVNAAPTIFGPTVLCEGDVVTYTGSPGGFTTWNSVAPGVVNIDMFGNAVAGTGGTTYISYTNTFNTCTTTITVHVNDSAFDIVTGPGGYTGLDSICQGNVITYAETAPGASGYWSNLYPAISTVDAFGNITGLSAGIDTIYYITPGCPTKAAPLRVDPNPAPITGSSSLCLGSTLTLTDTSPGGGWISTDMSVATVDATGIVTDVNPTIGVSTTIIYQLPTGCSTSLPVTVFPGPTAISGIDTVCQGAATTLVDTSHGGLWSSTALSIAQIIDTSGVVTGITPGTVTISYTLSNGCFQIYPFRVVPLTPAIVNIASSPGTTVCAGTPVTFSVTTTNAGTPTFEWHKFYTGYPSLSDTTILVDVPVHGDVIICKVITHGVCATHDTVMDTVVMNVQPIVTPSITITKTTLPDTIEYPGQVFTFYSNVTWGGTGPVYQWYVNSLPITGATSSSFSAAVYANDTFYCKVTGNAPCESPNVSFSNKIPIYGAWLGVNSLRGMDNTFTLFPNPNNGTLTLTGNATGALNIEVSDMLGHIVYRNTASPQNGAVSEHVTLDNSLPNGTYILRVSSENANEMFHFVIER